MPQEVTLGGETPPDCPQSPLEARFHQLVQEWQAQRGPSSSAARMAKLPAYRAIVGLGMEAVPLLLRELEKEPDHWFHALHEITGANPVPEAARGRVVEMARAWTTWGRKNGFSW